MIPERNPSVIDLFLPALEALLESIIVSSMH